MELQRLQVLTRRGAKALQSKVVKLLIYVFKHPIKSIFFTVKLYLSLLLCVFFLTATFSSFAQETVPAKQTQSSGSLTAYAPSHVDGCSFEGFGSCYENIMRSLIPDLHTLNCTYTPTGHTINFQCTGQRGTANTHWSSGDNAYFIEGGTTTVYSCPPDGFPNYTIKSGTGENTVCSQPYVEPTRPKTNCTQYAGAGADFASFSSNEHIPHEDRATHQCANRFSNNGLEYENYCHIAGGSGWTEAAITDANGVTKYHYTSIGGTLTGYDCDEQGNATDPDESCTAIDNGRLKKVTCPDGTEMSVNWGDYLDIKDAFLANRVSVSEDIGTLQNKVDSLEGEIVTTDEIIIALTTNEQFKSDVKGETGDSCTTVQDVANGRAIITCGSTSSYVQHGLAGARGAAGADGEKGEKGEECQAIQSGSGVSIVCPTSQATVMSGTDGQKGEDGTSCTTLDDGVDVIISCGETQSRLAGVDEEGIVGAIEKGTSYEGTKPTLNIANSTDLTNALGTPNDYQVRNYGTVIESAVNEMKQSPVYTSVEGFFTVSFTGSCPSYSTNVNFMNTSVTLDHWCRPVMDNIWPMIQAIIIFGFSFLAFRVAIL